MGPVKQGEAFFQKEREEGGPFLSSRDRIKLFSLAVAEIDLEVKNYLQRKDILSYKDSLDCGWFTLKLEPFFDFVSQYPPGLFLQIYLSNEKSIE
jgi:hypothetical protein